MLHQVKSDAEAWEFLITVVHKKNPWGRLGEFRIHTNNKGIRLFIGFTNQEYTGFHKDFDYVSSDGIFWVFPEPQYYPTPYYDTIVAKSLKGALNYHISQFPGNVENQPDVKTHQENQIQDWPDRWKWFSGTIEDFNKLRPWKK